jgi:deoxyadenosine/deoxycytidine kinase
MIIAVEGSIGSGKTTTATLVANRLGAPVVLENTVAHPFLEDFYADPARHAIQTELAFLLIHYHQLNALPSAPRVITDFAPAKDLAFAIMNLNKGDLKLFETVYDDLLGRVEQPLLTILLDVPVDVLFTRIRARGRPYEQQMAVEYLTRLRQSYEALMAKMGTAVEVLSVTPDDSPEAVAERARFIIERHLEDVR